MRRDSRQLAPGDRFGALALGLVFGGAIGNMIDRMVHREVIRSITDPAALDRILAELDIDHVYHLAAYLSTRSEFTPVTAHQVNVEGTMNLLEFAQRQAESHGRPVVFLYPSSIAAYGLPDLETKAKAGKVREEEFNTPTTMYGCNKLYCEHLGRYYSRHYKQLAAESHAGRVDFRAVRFVVISFEFDKCTFYFVCLGESDEIEITKTVPIGHWLSHDISHETPWKSVIGHGLDNFWQLSNTKGYDDAVMFQFGNERGNTRFILEAVASRFAVFGVTQN